MTLDPDKFRGALLGLAAGDALGTTVEFKHRGCFESLTTIVGGGPFGLKAGQWTDDTSMALCLADSLIHCKGMDLADQCERYLRWWRKGENSVTGECFDIGNTVRAALESYAATGNPHSGSTDPRSAGNGSIMRLAPAPLYFAGDPKAAILAARDSSRTTHSAPEAIDACRYLSALLTGAIHGAEKTTLLDPNFCEEFVDLPTRDLSPKIRAIAEGNFKTPNDSEISGSGYVVNSLQAALWAFWNTDNFRDGALLAVNLGDDADTTGAVYGQIAGAFYGEVGIPDEWLSILAWRDDISSIAHKLHDHASSNS